MAKKTFRKSKNPVLPGITELRKELDRRTDATDIVSDGAEVAQFRDSVKRGKAASRQYGLILDAGIKALRLDKNKLETAHKKETEAAALFHKENRLSIRKFYPEQKKLIRQKATACYKLQKSFTGTKSSQNPLIICMWIADSVYPVKKFLFQDGYYFPGDYSAPDIGENKFTCQVGAKGMGIVKYHIIHDFSWMADRTGLLNATGEIYMAGDYDLRACGNCGIGTGQSAELDVRYKFSISQMQNGYLLETATPWSIVKHKGVSAGCSTSEESGAIELHNVSFSNLSPFPVMSGSVVNFRVTTQLWANAIWWSGNPDPFADMYFREINVPAIIATVQ